MKLPQHVIVRAPGLLPMDYTIRELSGELGVPASTLRDWFKAGAPCRSDSRGHVWINGVEFSNWVKAQKRIPQYGIHLDDGQAYCFRCRSVQTIVHPEVHEIMGRLVHIRGTCPACGSVIIRGGCDDQPTKLP